MKILLATLLTLSAANAGFYAGLQIGSEGLRGKTSDGIRFANYQNYTFKKHSNSVGGFYGFHIGAFQNLGNFILSQELEISFNHAKKEQKFTVHDPHQGEDNYYHREVKHQGSIAASLKIAKNISDSVSVFIRPTLSMDRYQTKVKYFRFIYAQPYISRKTANILSYGIGIGLDKKIDRFVIGAETRFMTGGTVKSGHTPYPNVHVSNKSKPTRYMALIKVSYVF